MARLYLCGFLHRHDHIGSLRSLLWSYLPTHIYCLRQFSSFPKPGVKKYIAG